MLNTTTEKKTAVGIIIIINCIMFIPYLLAYITGYKLPLALLSYFGALSTGLDGGPSILSGHVYQLITSMFIHGGIMHLVFNMYALYLFGSPIEKRWGSRSFVLFYLVVGILANIASFIFFRAMQIPTHLIGASGAIFGVLLAFGAYYPETTLLVFFIIPMKTKFVIPLMAALELFFEVSGTVSGVAHITHLFGFVFAFFYLLFVFRINAVKKMYFPGKDDYIVY